MREFRRDLSVVGRIVRAPATELHNQSINVNLEFSCRFEAIIMFAHVAEASKTFLERHFRHIIADDGNESALAPGGSSQKCVIPCCRCNTVSSSRALTYPPTTVTVLFSMYTRLRALSAIKLFSQKSERISMGIGVA